MPVYKKSPGKWRVRVWAQGKRQDWIFEGSKSDAEDFEARKRLEAPPTEIRGTPTLADFVARHYKPHAQAHLKPRTWQNRTYQLATLIEHLGGVRLDRISASEVEAFKTARTKAGIRPSTVNDDLKVLSAVLAYARSLGIPVPKLAAKRLPERGARRNAEAWTREEVERLLEATPSWLRPIIVFLLNTGCRKGEALALEWSNVDAERGVVRIWASEEWQPKDGDNREVPLNARVREAIGERPPGARYVFPVRRGRGKGGRLAYWPQNTFDRAVKAAKLTGGPHKLRHTYATHFLAATGDLFTLGRILGHSHARVTELYGHLLPDAIVRAASAVNF